MAETIEEYFKKEVLPHVSEAWIVAGKTDDKDGAVGIVGYEIPFNRHFYVYQPPRPPPRDRSKRSMRIWTK